MKNNLGRQDTDVIVLRDVSGRDTACHVPTITIACSGKGWQAGDVGTAYTPSVVKQTYPRLMRIALLILIMVVSAACNLGRDELVDSQQPIAQAQQDETTPTTTPTDEFPGEPLPSLTPSNTLRPPPTFEPPTLTPEPSATPSITPTPTIEIAGNLPALQGLHTATPGPGTPSACEPREDWTLRYEVQANDAIARIAEKYNIAPKDLADGNCLPDMNLIVVGQFLRVPGEAHPAVPGPDCTWELLTPFNGTITVPGEGTITFNWNGPEAPRYLVRVWKNTDASGPYLKEFLTEFMTHYTMDLEELPEGGTYSWKVFPIGLDFLQTGCPESYHMIFTKAPAPTPMPSQGATGP